MLALYRSGRQSEALAAYQTIASGWPTTWASNPGRSCGTSRCRSCARSRRSVPRLTERGPASGNLPRGLTSFVGRAAELAALAQRLADNRLVTLTGPGGVGKTRLAVEIAHQMPGRFGDGGGWSTWRRSLPGRQVPAAVAQALRVDATACAGRAHRHRRPALPAVRGHCLVVLDNCEHVAAACAGLLRRILSTCPQASVLATSRRPLGVEGEYVLPLSSMSDAGRGAAVRGTRGADRPAPRRRLDAGTGHGSLPAARRAASRDRAGRLPAPGAQPLGAGRAGGRPAGLPRRPSTGRPRGRAPCATWCRGAATCSQPDTQLVFARCGVFLGVAVARGCRSGVRGPRPDVRRGPRPRHHAGRPLAVAAGRWHSGRLPLPTPRDTAAVRPGPARGHRVRGCDPPGPRGVRRASGDGGRSPHLRGRRAGLAAADGGRGTERGRRAGVGRRQRLETGRRPGRRAVAVLGRGLGGAERHRVPRPAARRRPVTGSPNGVPGLSSWPRTWRPTRATHGRPCPGHGRRWAPSPRTRLGAGRTRSSRWVVPWAARGHSRRLPGCWPRHASPRTRWATTCSPPGP